MKFIWHYNNVILIEGCLAHGTDICPDCLLEKCCGKGIRNNECHFMKKSEMVKMVQEQTTKIEEWARDIFLTDIIKYTVYCIPHIHVY